MSKSSKTSLIDNVSTDLSPLAYSVELQACVAQVGFDWPSVKEILAKLQEEIAELQAEIESNQRARILDEFGDILFCCANLARHLNVDPEVALAHANQKFVRRFREVEKLVGSMNKNIADLDFSALLEVWEQVKVHEKK